MDEWVSEWVSEWVNEWMNEWINQSINQWNNLIIVLNIFDPWGFIQQLARHFGGWIFTFGTMWAAAPPLLVSAPYYTRQTSEITYQSPDHVQTFANNLHWPRAETTLHLGTHTFTAQKYWNNYRLNDEDNSMRIEVFKATHEVSGVEEISEQKFLRPRNEFATSSDVSRRWRHRTDAAAVSLATHQATTCSESKQIHE